MTRMAGRVGWVVLALCLAGPASAQSFTGKGPEPTQAFPLTAGSVTFAFEHHGDGTFTVRLLDADDAVVDELASGTGTFGGSKVVRIARTGEYHVDVQAPGEWKVEVTGSEAANPDDPSTVRGRTDGAAAGGRAAAGGWLGKGFLGGLIAGPMGTGFVVSRASSSAERDAAAAVPGGSAADLAYSAAYRAAYRDRLASRRKRNGVIGGLVGTGVFVYALTQVIHLKSGGSDGGIPSDGGGVPLLVVPIRF